jgi:TatD DNase family protein
MALIDFHCHLDLYSDPHVVAAEATTRGVFILSVTTTPTAFVGTQALAPAGGRIRTALGLHPEIAVGREHELRLFEELLPLTRYVGEVGLDGSRAHRHTLDRQGGILTEILALSANAGGKIISLHSRGAASAVLDVISIEPRAGIFVLHWFNGSSRQVRRASEMECWFSVGCNMLTSERGRDAVAAMPRDRILPETDGPFGFRGDRPAWPWEAVEIVPMLAGLWHEDPNDVASQLDRNFRTLVDEPQPRSRDLFETTKLINQQ